MGTLNNSAGGLRAGACDPGGANPPSGLSGAATSSLSTAPPHAAFAHDAV